MNTLDLYIKIQISYCLWKNLKVCVENWHLEVLKTLENQGLKNAVTRDEKYVKII